MALPNKKLNLFLFAFLLLAGSSVAYADNVVYILSNTANPNGRLLSELQGMGFTVDLVDDSDIGTIDWSEYKFMLIGDDTFSDPTSIPVNTYPALIVNSKHMDEWHWASKMSQKTSSQAITGYVNNQSDPITYEFPMFVKVYNASTPTLYYLHRYYKATGIKTKIATDDGIDSTNSVIGTAKKGTVLRDGVVSNAKTVFIGATNTNYWTNYTEIAFKNAATWLATDFVTPGLYNITVSGITNSSATVIWGTDKLATSNVTYWSPTASVKNSTLTKHHMIQLNSLSEKTTYSYKIRSCNEDNFCNTSTVRTFTTADWTAPKLTLTAAAPTNESADLNGQTSELAGVKVYYGTIKTDLAYSTTRSALESSWTFTIQGLPDKTLFYYKADMCDDAGNCRNSSIYNFTTQDITAPQQVTGLMLAVNNTDNSLILSWDANSDDTIKYNIYRSEDRDGPWDVTPYAAVTADHYHDSTAQNFGQLYYIVRAEDAHDNEEGNQDVVGKFDLELKTGYNLVSIPLEPFDSDLSTVMHQTSSYHPVSEIKRYDAQNGQFQTQVFLVLTWNLMSTFQELDAGGGYFFKTDADTNFTIVGMPKDSLQIEMKEGMNLIGLISDDDKAISDVITQTPEDLDVTEIGKRGAGGKYILATYYPDGWHNAFMLEPGVGYWLKANKDFTLELND